MSQVNDTEEGTSPSPQGVDYMSGRDFVDFPLTNDVLEGLHSLGYRTATPVQAAAIEPALAGTDLVVRAKTGTGKTVAFAVPVVQGVDPKRKVAQAVILAPTRELAQQIHEVVEAIGKPRGLSAALLVGGMPMPPQIRVLEDGAQIIVGTPGRILDHMKRGNLSLAEAHFACLDEADEMVSMGFVEDVTNILRATKDERQVLLFSATVSPETERIIARFLRDPEEIFLSTDMDQVEGIEHVLYEHSPNMHKFRALLYLLDMEDPKAAIIFCNRRDDANTVAAYLDRQGLDTQLISGELPQVQRMRAMAKVKAGAVRFLVATDVAARGIDISELSHVIHFSLPQDPAVYLHRSGRTGRLGRKGVSISLVGGTDLSTRNALEWQHGIKFTVKTFPDEAEVVGHRVEHQVQQIRAAMGTLAFEAYLPTARMLMARPDGEILLAASLRAFFQWDRARKAAALEAPEPAPIQQEVRPRRRDRRDEEPPPRRTESLDALLVEEEPAEAAPKRKRRRKKSEDEAPRRASPPASLPDLDDLLIEADDLLVEAPAVELSDVDALLVEADDLLVEADALLVEEADALLEEADALLVEADA
ncbi:MAG: DEAD/DEAH box helicase, partial [Deltaproteobacteria bacterium]|nr:DEAD/DEAH box helicase [Deltaproteobacteria bacterium]